MAIYGREGAYFRAKPDGFINSTWIELIGFDNAAVDYGVGNYLDTLGFIPHIVSFHLSSIDMVNTHLGMEKEYPLPVYGCSYGGHEVNDDRERQNWTNYQIKGLVDALHRRGIQVFSSFFDLEYDRGWSYPPSFFTDTCPELRCVDRDGTEHLFIYMIKRFADGTPFIDYMLPRLLRFAGDYGLDGVQLADGISSPRLSLEEADYSDDMVGRFLAASGIQLEAGLREHCQNPEEFRRRADWIYANHRWEWISFITGEWRDFMTTCIKALKNRGIKAAFNSAWTKDPLEALYRYGTDYKAYEEAGAHNFVVEDVSADLSILADEENGYLMGYDHRKFIHYEFLANLMCNKAMMPGLPMTPLSMIRDTLEQWDVLHHAPTAMQRAAGANLNSFLVTPRGLVPVTNGPWFCLADGLTKAEWDEIRVNWDNAYTPRVKDVPGYTILWSAARMQKELEDLIHNRGWHTAKWLAELLSRGVPVHKIAPLSYLDAVSGPLLVPNPALMDKDELARVCSYTGGIVVYVGMAPPELSAGTVAVSESPWQKVSMSVSGDGKRPVFEKKSFADSTPRPDRVEALGEFCSGIWTHPLRFHPVAEGFIDYCTEILLKLCAYPYLTGDTGACHVHQVQIDDHADRFLIDNDEYYYVLPVLHVERTIKKVEFITKPLKYPAQVTDHTVRFRVPLRGMDILEITYKD
ncbi:MAG: hypothetical protein LBD96_11220 [Treponema sp.]|jgi:hypothetical protein|nr:hypothetical protein [Treponema sp.]